MHYSKFTLLTILWMFLSIFNTYSQNTFGIHVGAANPVSDFASDDISDEDAGGAAVGFNIGLDYTYHTSESNLGVFASLDFNYNSLEKKVKEDIKEEIGTSSAYYSFYNYYNIPVSAGFDYTFNTQRNLSFFANAGLTLNFLKLSDFDIRTSTAMNVTEFDISTNFGVKIGGGIMYNKKINIAFHYLGLGKHEISGEMFEDGRLPARIEFEQRISLTTITLGYNF